MATIISTQAVVTYRTNETSRDLLHLSQDGGQERGLAGSDLADHSHQLTRAHTEAHTETKSTHPLSGETGYPPRGTYRSIFNSLLFF